MIKHHPKFELLQCFVNGDLPASIAAAISIHADMCPQCQQQITLLTEQVAELSFELGFDSTPEPIADYASEQKAEKESDYKNSQEPVESSALDTELVLDFEDMIANITESDTITSVKKIQPKSITFKGQQYSLPTALTNMTLGKTANIGKLSRARIQLAEGEIHSSLLHIEPGGSVPEHTHKGFELTLLLEGSFTDEKGEYVKGDFIMLDGNHQHHPISAQGCLCYTVANDALHFTQGINKLLNPIGSLIY